MRIVVLDSWRGLFAVAIALLHAPFQGYLHYNAFVRNGAVFVDFFFVLSGFVISLAYCRAIRDGHTLAGFLVRRTGRLWPLHALMLALFLLVLAAKLVAGHLGFFAADLPYSIPEIQGYALENAFLVQAFRNETVYWLNFPSWSISVEFWVYVTFGLACLMPRLLPLAAAGIILFATAVIFGLVDPGFGHFFGNGLFRGLASFFLGYLIYLLRSRLGAVALPAPQLLECGFVAAIVWLVALSSGPVRSFLLPLVFALTILVFSYESGAVSRLLKTRPLVLLGSLSYSTYMVHIFVYSVLGIVVRRVERALHLDLYSPDLRDPPANDLLDFGPPLVNDAAMLLMLGVVLACAFLTYRLVELPGQRIARAFAREIEALPAEGR